MSSGWRSGAQDTAVIKGGGDVKLEDGVGGKQNRGGGDPH